MKKLAFVLFLTAAFLLKSYGQPSNNLDSLWNMSLEDLMDIEVSGVSRFAQNIGDIPNSIQVITQQQITDRGYQDLGDVLKDLNDIDVVDNAGQFGEFYSIRGIEGNDRFLILINGHKINPSSGTHVSTGNSISIRYADRIEVIYGPASAIYGADAYSGIINIVINQNDDNKNNVSSSVNYGSLNSIDANIKTEMYSQNGFSLFMMARYFQSDGPNFTNADLSNYNYSVVNSYPSPLKSNFEQPTNDHTVYLKTGYKNFTFNYFRKQFNEGNALGFVPSIYIYNKENKWKNSTDLAWFTYKKDLKNDAILMFDLSYKYHLQDNNTIYYKWNIPDVFDPNQTYKQYMTGKDNTILTSLTYNQQIGSCCNIVFGVDNEYSNMIPPYANDEILGMSSQFSGDNATIIENELTITENRSAAFGQITFTPWKVLNVTIGGRYDYSIRYGSVFNPRLGLIFKPFDKTQIKLNYGHSFQAPSLFFEYEQWGAPTIVNISAHEMLQYDPNWKLKNQLVKSQEFSINQTIFENINIVITGYYNKLENIIERTAFSDSVYNKYFNNYTVGLRNENIGNQEIIGGNVLLSAKVAKKLTIHTYYSYSDAVSLTGGEVNFIPRVSLHKVWAGFTANNLFDHFTISSSFKWVSDLYNMNALVFPDNNQAGYYLINANLSINNIGKHLRIFANFENLLNTYIEHGGLYEQSGVYTATIPQQGFTFKAGLEITLGE